MQAWRFVGVGGFNRATVRQAGTGQWRGMAASKGQIRRGGRRRRENKVQLGENERQIKEKEGSVGLSKKGDARSRDRPTALCREYGKLNLRGHRAKPGSDKSERMQI